MFENSNIQIGNFRLDFMEACITIVRLFLLQGRQSRLFDYSREENEKEFTMALSSPNGQVVAIGSFDKIRIFTWSPRQSAWNELANKEIDKLYSVTAMSWRRDGAR